MFTFQVRGVGMECVDPLNSRPELLVRECSFQLSLNHSLTH